MSAKHRKTRSAHLPEGKLSFLSSLQIVIEDLSDSHIVCDCNSWWKFYTRRGKLLRHRDFPPAADAHTQYALFEAFTHHILKRALRFPTRRVKENLVSNHHASLEPDDFVHAGQLPCAGPN
eukprot:CAMPEP_0171673166 /NCGR_PEP_ID=MMETSP0990-20121206/52410_1 /TAXON_ID=483369 /ORGANISM="non described non described, Strain CCMP2098" /LENGTH=120 /DNA_ID=CAMNT_0012258569 /DNA_START=75 /DNA_END=434 /DNA_ORIENTATION=+